MWLQKKILISPKPRGFHLITTDIINNINIIRTVKNGLLNLFIKHTSASLTINENTDPTVRDDFESHFNQIIPEQQGYYSHTMEGPDDMPAHLKSSILGASINIPITNGKLNLGTWQGIYLCEHRNRGGSRQIIATINGDSI
jgi:secondary thiamine-phosphate synthase enzyme|tara:strand:- start:885 stop:1310 length:426 start_codon:yes stop_codon:yes gene_type:complete